MIPTTKTIKTKFTELFFDTCRSLSSCVGDGTGLISDF